MLQLVGLFLSSLLASPVWNDAVDAGICSIPLSEDWESRQFVTAFVPLWTRPRYNLFLMAHLLEAGIMSFAIDPPIVPRGTGRVRLAIHAGNTEDEVRLLIDSICAWGQEMMDIERGTKTGVRFPSAIRNLNASMAAAGVQLLDGRPNIL